MTLLCFEKKRLYDGFIERLYQTNSAVIMNNYGFDLHD